MSHPLLRIDNVSHELGDVAVLSRADSLPGGIPWSMYFDEACAQRFVTLVPRLRSGRPTLALAAEVFVALRNLLSSERRQARFVISSVDQITASVSTIQLTGRCAPLLLDALGPGGLTRRYGGDPKS